MYNIYNILLLYMCLKIKSKSRKKYDHEGEEVVEITI